MPDEKEKKETEPKRDKGEEKPPPPPPPPPTRRFTEADEKLPMKDVKDKKSSKE